MDGSTPIEVVELYVQKTLICTVSQHNFAKSKCNVTVKVMYSMTLRVLQFSNYFVTTL